MGKRIHNRTKYFLNGLPAIDIARSNGISKSCVYDRLSAGWDLTKACTYKKIPIKVLADKIGITQSKANFMRRNGVSYEDLEAMANGRKI